MFADHAGEFIHHGLFVGRQLHFAASFLKCRWHNDSNLARVGQIVNLVNLANLVGEPKLQVLGGWPHSSQKYGGMASKTSAKTGVVALWSR